jgi:competence protein ComEA
MEWENLTTKQKILLGIGGLIVLILGAFWYLNQERSTEDTAAFSLVTDQQDDIVENSEVDLLFVEITGHVLRPGVYQIKSGTMLLELISFAGGLDSFADLNHLHQNLPLAKELISNEKFFIPAVSATQNSTTNSATKISEKISINNSTLEELMTLSGIGEATAKKIIEARPFSELEELLDVSGIGEAIYTKIVSQITL